MKKADDALLEFPVEIAVKAMGRAADDFESLVHDLVSTHLQENQSASVTTLDSSKGNYVSVSVRFTANSREQLNAIYQDLHDCERVLYTL